MKPSTDASSRAAVSAKFDLLRVKLETTVVRPAVIVVVASTAGDGGEVAGRSLASALASAGYSALFVDTLEKQDRANSGFGQSLGEIGLLQAARHPKPGIVAVLALGDLALQKTTSQRDVDSAMSIFRANFDYVVIVAEYASSRSFATSLFIAADAVVVPIRKGRREEDEDARLAAALDTIGSRFLGLVALDAAIIEKFSNAASVSTTFDVRRGQSPLEREPKRRENAESAT